MIAETMDPRVADDIEELSLLLPTWQITALAEVAESEGLTVAQFMRRLVKQTLALAQMA